MSEKTYRHFRRGMYLLSGFLFALPMIVSALAPLSYLSFIPVFLMEWLKEGGEEKHPYRWAYGRGFLFFYAYGLVTFYWFVELYPLDFISVTKIEALGIVALGWFGLSLLQTLVAAFLFVLLRLIQRKAKPSAWIMIPVTASFYALFEFLQTLTWAGVPWGKLAMGQAGMLPFIQSVSLFGPYFLAFLIVFVNGCLAFAFQAFLKKDKKSALAWCLTGVLLFAGNLAFGLVRLSGEASGEEPVKVAAIQGNVSSKEKWDIELSAMNMQRYLDLSAEAAEAGAEIVVWPESALPFTLYEGGATAQRLASVSRLGHCYLFAGAFQQKDGNSYNAIYCINKEGNYSQTVYAKQHLVPFGEYVPWREFFQIVFPPLSRISPAQDEFTPGEDSAVFLTEYGKVGSLVCFDSIYEALARQSVRDGAEILFISTNDSWFGDSPAVWQHERHAVLRAVENGRYVVRAANTGVSAVISDRGEILTELDPLVTGYISSEVDFLQENTLYTTIGDLFLWVSCFLSLLLLIPWRRHEI